MMKRRVLALFLAALILAAFSAAEADEVRKPDNRQIMMRISVCCLTEEGSRAVGDRTALSSDRMSQLIDSRKAREIERLSFPVRCSENADIFLGNKFPLTYYDSRSSQYQAIFIDVGLKFLVRPEIAEDNTLKMTVHSSVSSIEDYRQEIERDTLFYFPSVKTSDITQTFDRIKNNETVVISHHQGALVESMLKDIGLQEGLNLKGSRLMITLTPHMLPAIAAGDKGLDSPAAIEVKTLCLSRELSKKLQNDYRISGEALSSLVKAGARVINSQRILSSGSDACIMLGRNYPLPYYSPGSGFYQVIYHYIGFRDDFKCERCGPNRWKVHVKHELSSADPAMLFGVKREQMPLKIYSTRADSSIELARGESGIMLALKGEYYLKAVKEILLPGMEISPDDELLFIVTIR